VCGRVRFTECLSGALDAFGVLDAIEFGNGKVLAGLAKRTAPSLSVRNVTENLSST
jgi:malonyl CoA-acyl carrier protein transacylase